MSTLRTARAVGPVLALFALGAISASSLDAQPLELLGDLRPESIVSYGHGVAVIGSVNGRALLHAPGEAFALWATNGTAAGTLPIADVSFGGGISALVVNVSPTRAFVLVDSLGQISGGRIFSTDGTRVGTFVLRNADGVPLVPETYQTAADEHGAYLLACAGDRDCGWWFNDGNSASSHLLVPRNSADGQVREVALVDASLYWTSDSSVFTTRFDQPGARLVFGAADSYIRVMTASNDRLYFVALTTGGFEAWSSDGTPAGTTVLTEFPDDDPFSSFVTFQAAGGRVYFVADDTVHGQELWSTDGSRAGTRRETDFGYDQPFGNWVSAVAEIGGKLLFGARDGLNRYQLWAKSDNAAAVPLLEPCGSGCWPLVIGGGLLAVEGRVYFGGTDLNHGSELWSSDGTKSGTRLLVDACPGPCAGWPSDLYGGRATLSGGRVFAWTLNDLWVTDGSPEGTRSIYHHEDESPAFPDMILRQAVPVGERFVFAAPDTTYGEEIFVSDEALESSELLTDLLGDSASSLAQNFTTLGQRVAFTAIPGPGGAWASLWMTDGTAAGTAEVPGVRLPACDSLGRLCHGFTAVGNRVFYMQTEESFNDYQLWRTDGSVGGLLQLTLGLDGFTSWSGVAWSDKLLFIRGADPQGIEFWSSDGSLDGTRALFTLPDVRSVQTVTAVGPEFYFTALNGQVPGTWRSDGTLVGSRRIATFGSSREFVRAGNLVWFLAKDSSAGELWVTDGTAAGTRLVANVNSAKNLVSLHGVLYFLAQASPTERALWRVNAQNDGITQIARFPGDGFSGGGTAGLTVFEGNLYLVANSIGEGHELWRSDGTLGGTRLVRDINPGPDGSRIGPLTATPHGLFFAADDGAHGPELWRSDGTAAGTLLVGDLEPGPVGSFPSVPAVAGTHLVFGATETRSGREPWRLDLVAPRACVTAETALCLNGSRFRVTAEWKDFAGNRGVGHAVGLTADTGYFWFFRQENVEVVIKVLDGHGFNGHEWVFYGALSSIEYTLTVTDTQTGAVRRYFNPSGRLASVGDTQGFGPLGGYARMPPPAAAPAPAARRIASGDTSPCVASDTRLCLNGGRFAVESTWKDFAGNTGVGHAHALTGDTGYLWFFAATNVEVVIKVLDGTPLNGKFWLFYGALSSVEYTLTVRDTVTGAVRVYRNTSGNMASVADTSAF
jgi:ELWxxDGT repeat protein